MKPGSTATVSRRARLAPPAPVLRELVVFVALAGAGLCVLLLAGQVAQLRDVLWAAGRVPLRALTLGAVVLTEALLPLAGLVGAALAYGRLRAEGVLLARSALGGGPLGALAPAAAIGLALGLAAAALAQRTVPRAVDALRGLVTELAAGAFAQSERAVGLPGGGAIVGRPLWAALPAGEGVALLQASAATVATQPGTLRFDLRDVRLWSPGLRVTVREATVRADDGGLGRRLGMLGPPNATPSAALPASAHGRFVWHRRWSVPAMAPLWAVFGAVLGGALGGLWAAVTATALVALGYGALRMGEISARAGDLSPLVAAWTPVVLTALLLALVAPRLVRRLD